MHTPTESKKEKPEKKQLIKSLWVLFSVGWFVALSLVVPTAIGLWLDTPERFNTRPLCTLIGFVLGATTAGYGFYKMLRQFMNEQKDMVTKKKNKEQEGE